MRRAKPAFIIVSLAAALHIITMASEGFVFRLSQNLQNDWPLQFWNAYNVIAFSLLWLPEERRHPALSVIVIVLTDLVWSCAIYFFFRWILGRFSHRSCTPGPLVNC
jgi:hypothetical protein